MYIRKNSKKKKKVHKGYVPGFSTMKLVMSSCLISTIVLSYSTAEKCISLILIVLDPDMRIERQF